MRTVRKFDLHGPSGLSETSVPGSQHPPASPGRIPVAVPIRLLRQPPSAPSRATSSNAEHAEDAENVNDTLLADGSVNVLSFSAIFALSALSAFRRRRLALPPFPRRRCMVYACGGECNAKGGYGKAL